MNINNETFISWGVFTTASLCIYYLYPVADAILTKCSQKYNEYATDRKEYILTNIIKSNVLVVISGMVIGVITDDNVNLLTVRNKTKQYLIWKNIAALYACTDFVGLVKNKKMQTSTLIHHYCVLIMYVVISVLDFDQESVFKAAVMYGAFSSLAFLVNFYLGLRFLVQKHGKCDLIIKNLSAVSYILVSAINWSWQIYYLKMLYSNSSNIYNIAIQYILYITALVAWVSDDLKLMHFLLT